VRYQYFRDIVTNANVGQFNLPETGSDTLGVEQRFRQRTPRSSERMQSTSRGSNLFHADNENTPLQPGRPWMLAERFRGNGSGGFGTSNIQNRYEFQNTTF